MCAAALQREVHKQRLASRGGGGLGSASCHRCSFSSAAGHRRRAIRTSASGAFQVLALVYLKLLLRSAARCSRTHTEALIKSHLGNQIAAGFQCLAGASLGESGEEFAALRIAGLDVFGRVTLDVGEFFDPALL
jgi:hypothetical protein